jgi:hypothetical protein
MRPLFALFGSVGSEDRGMLSESGGLVPNLTHLG